MFAHFGQVKGLFSDRFEAFPEKVFPEIISGKLRSISGKTRFKIFLGERLFSTQKFFWDPILMNTTVEKIFLIYTITFATEFRKRHWIYGESILNLRNSYLHRGLRIPGKASDRDTYQTRQSYLTIRCAGSLTFRKWPICISGKIFPEMLPEKGKAFQGNRYLLGIKLSANILYTGLERA